MLRKNKELLENFQNINTYGYQGRVYNFICWYDSKYKKYILDPKELEKLPLRIENYRHLCASNGNSKRTIINKTVAINALFSWATRKNLVKFNPIKDKLERIRFKESDKIRKSYFLTVEQIAKVRELMEIHQFDLQSKILFELFLDSACRISSIHSIKIPNLEQGRFTGIVEKEGYIVNAIFFDRCAKYIEEWLEYRKENNINSEYLFLTKYQGEYKQMGKDTIRTKIRAVGELIGIPDLYPHTLRKTAINLIYNSGGIELASRYANHLDTRTTYAHYVKDDEDIINEIRKIRNKIGI